MTIRKMENIKAYMGADTSFNGTLAFSGTVRIDGKFQGKVETSDTLIVGEKGLVEADIQAGIVICKGIVRGTIVAKEKVEIHSSSEVVGNIVAPQLYVEVGAVFDGQCEMTQSGKKIIQLVKDGEEAASSGY
ncbi:MAG: polymer-forming cytoskeletal protein [Nitrospinaceae bacterium]